MTPTRLRTAIAFSLPYLLATAAHGFTYQIDDGSAELTKGALPGGAIAWLNSFQVEPGAETLTSIDIVLKPFGPSTVVHPVDVFLWTDPTNDGNPVDAVVARSIASSTTPVGSFVNLPIAPLTLPAGSWFFAGGIYARPADDFDASPSAVDSTAPIEPNRSFLVSWPNDSSLANPNDLSAGAFFFGPDRDGNYLIRVNAVPEPSALGLVFGLLIAFGAWRRRGS